MQQEQTWEESRGWRMEGGCQTDAPSVVVGQAWTGRFTGAKVMVTQTDNGSPLRQVKSTHVDGKCVEEQERNRGTRSTRVAVHPSKVAWRR